MRAPFVHHVGLTSEAFSSTVRRFVQMSEHFIVEYCRN